MKPRERRETGEMDLSRSRLDQIINMNHELVRLAKTVSWEAIEARCGEVYSDGPGMPPLPTRLMAGLVILKHTFNLSDDEFCARWVENPYFQFFCGETFFRPRSALRPFLDDPLAAEDGGGAHHVPAAASAPAGGWLPPASR